MQRYFQSRIHELVNVNTRALFYQESALRWMSLTQKCLGIIVTFICTILALFGQTSPGVAGLIITYALSVTEVV